MLRRTLLITALVAATACGKNTPVAPSNTGAGADSLVITGTTSLDRPGDTTQLTATRSSSSCSGP